MVKPNYQHARRQRGAVRKARNQEGSQRRQAHTDAGQAAGTAEAAPLVMPVE